MKTNLKMVLALLAVSNFAQAADPSKGESLFSSRACIGCHAIGTEGSGTTGPNLAGVTRRRTEQWLIRWISAPDQMRDDPIYQELKAKFGSDMPNMGLTADETESIVQYLKKKTGS